MGLILESTSEMGLWIVETRRESFVLLGPGDDDRLEAYYDDIPKLRAALNLVEQKRRS